MRQVAGHSSKGVEIRVFAPNRVQGIAMRFTFEIKWLPLSHMPLHNFNPVPDISCSVCELRGVTAPITAVLREAGGGGVFTGIQSVRRAE